MNTMVYFFLALTAVLAATANAMRPVLDINGDVVFRGSYYVLPFVGGQGGGLTLSGRTNKPCPLDIVQAKSVVDNGLPVKFSNWMPLVAFVPESTSINIETDVAATICIQSTYWWIDEVYQVATGPKSFFIIKKAENFDAYKFMFCPNNCVDVGIFIDESGVRRLALSSEPFWVQFKKANVSDDSSNPMSIISV